MAYSIYPLKGRNGLLTGTVTYVVPLTPSMIGSLVCIVKVASVSAGITNLNPVTLSLAQSWDGGLSFVTVSGTITQKDDNVAITTIYGAGNYLIRPTPASKRLSPQLQLVITIPAGESIITEQIARTFVSSEEAGAQISISDLTISTTAAATALNIDGSLEEVTLDTLTPANNIGLPVTLMQDQGKSVLTPVDSTATQISAPNINSVIVASAILGWTGSEHKEVGMGPQSSIKTVDVYSNAAQTAIIDYSTSNLNSTPATIMTLTNAVHCIDIADTSGEIIDLFVGGVLQFRVPRGGATYDVDPTKFASGAVLTIAAQTGVTISSGEIIVNAFEAYASY